VGGGLSYLELDGLLHGAQVDGDVGGVGHQPPVRPEERAGEVQPLLDVGGDGCPLQDAAHLLCGGTRRTLRRGHPGWVGVPSVHPPPRCGTASPPTCDAHEAVGEDGKLDGVEVGANGARGSRADGDADVAEARQAGGAARLHHDGAAGAGGRTGS